MAVLLDTDAIIKLSEPVNEEPSLLEHFLSIKGEYYLHEYIIDEVQWPEYVSSKLLMFINEGKIIKVTDQDLMNMLTNSKVLPDKRTFLSILRDCCDLFGVDYYEEEYYQLESFLDDQYDDSKFLEEFNQINNRVIQRGADNLGEIKTAFLAAIFYTLDIKEFTYFVSVDKRARNTMVLKYNNHFHSINTISVIACLYYLKHNGLSKSELLKYLKLSEHKIYDSSGKLIKLSINKIIDEIYDNRIICLKNGMLKEA